MYFKGERRMPKENLYKLGEKLGLNKNDIDGALKYGTISDKQASLSFGPGWYNWGTFYGTVSINDF